MAHAPIDDIVAWSATQAPWRQDCLRRLATSADLTLADLDELLAIIKTAAGFTLPSPPPAAMSVAKAHFVGSADTPITLKGISNITRQSKYDGDWVGDRGPIRWCYDAGHGLFRSGCKVAICERRCGEQCVHSNGDDAFFFISSSLARTIHAVFKVCQIHRLTTY